MPYLHLLLAVSCLCLCSGCGSESEDRFFSGRPSPMAMLHGKTLDGTVESMVELLKVPARFRDPQPGHISMWQYSVSAWWPQKDGRRRIMAALARLNPTEFEQVVAWSSTISPSSTEPNRKGITEFREALRQFDRSQ